MTGSKDQICQAVQAFEKSGLPTPGWAKDRKDLAGVDIEINIPKSLDRIVIEIEISDDDFGLLRHETPFKSDAGYTG